MEVFIIFIKFVMLAQKIQQLLALGVSLTYSFWSNAFCIPLFITFNIFSLFREATYQIWETLRQFYMDYVVVYSPVRICKNVIGYLKRTLSTYCKEEESLPRSKLLRHSRSQQEITDTIMKAEANPHSMAQNEKVLLMVQKMKRLEDTLFQQSKDRQKIQKELIEARNELKEKNVALIKETKQCVENMNKINLLNSHLTQTNELLDKSTKYVTKLEEEIKQMKDKMEHILVNKNGEEEITYEETGEKHGEKHGENETQNTELNEKEEDSIGQREVSQENEQKKDQETQKQTQNDTSNKQKKKKKNH